MYLKKKKGQANKKPSPLIQTNSKQFSLFHFGIDVNQPFSFSQSLFLYQKYFAKLTKESPKRFFFCLLFFGLSLPRSKFLFIFCENLEKKKTKCENPLQFSFSLSKIKSLVSSFIASFFALSQLPKKFTFSIIFTIVHNQKMFLQL